MTLLLFGCSNETEQTTNTNKESTNDTQLSTPSPTPLETTEPDIQEVPAQSLSELYPAYEKLEALANKTNTFSKIGYHAYTNTELQYEDSENNSRIRQLYFVSETNADLESNPKALSSYAHTITGSADLIDGEWIYADDSVNVFTNYIAQAGKGLFIKADTDDQWYRTHFDNTFPTMENLTILMDLFKRYPDQLEFKDEVIEAEGCCGSDEDYIYHTLSLNLSDEQFSELLPFLNSNFIYGIFDGTHYDDSYFDFLSKQFTNKQLILSYDEDHYLTDFDIYFSSPLAEGNPNDFYQFSAEIRFFGYDYNEAIVFPEEIEALAIEIEY